MLIVEISMLKSKNTGKRYTLNAVRRTFLDVTSFWGQGGVCVLMLVLCCGMLSGCFYANEASGVARDVECDITAVSTGILYFYNIHKRWPSSVSEVESFLSSTSELSDFSASLADIHVMSLEETDDNKLMVDFGRNSENGARFGYKLILSEPDAPSVDETGSPISLAPGVSPDFW
jgi:hypothetical protein